MACAVRMCRFRSTHLTSYHTCGSCGQMGHGRLECGNARRIEELRSRERLMGSFAGVYCTVPGCNRYTSHSFEAHVCERCGLRKPVCRCPLDREEEYGVELDLQCPLCKAECTVDVSKNIYAPGTECVVCMESTPLVLLNPCNHLCLCASCARRLHGTA